MTDTDEQQNDSSSRSADDPAAPELSSLRVAWITGSDVLHAHGETLRAAAVGLMDEFVELTAICPQSADTNCVPSPPLDLIRHGRLRWLMFDLPALGWLATEVKARKVQLLHATDAEGANLARKLSHELGIPYVISAWSAKDARQLHSAKDAASILAASDPIRRALLAHHVAPGDRIELLRPAVHYTSDATCFEPGSGAVAIVAGGDMNHYRPFEAVLHTFASLRVQEQEYVFFLVGNGRAEKRLRGLAEQLNLMHEVTFVDRQPASRMPDVFRAADVYVSVSAERTFDTWSLLAIAAGVPVLAAGGGAGDFLIDGQTSLEFTQGDSVSLTKNLSALLDDRQAARELAQSALAHLRKYHSTAAMVSALAATYRNAIK